MQVLCGTKLNIHILYFRKPTFGRSSSFDNCQASLSEYWKIFFAFRYAFLCCPFHMKRTGSSTSSSLSSFKAKQWLPQKILWVILATANIVWMQHYARKSIPRNLKNPSEYLKMMSEINITILKLLLLRVYWIGQQDFVNIVNFLSQNNRVFSCKIPFVGRPGKVLFFCWCSIYPLLMSIEWILSAKDKEKNGISWLARQGNIGRKAFFLETVTSEIPLNQTMSPIQIIGSILISVSQFNQDIFYLYLPIITFMPLATLWAIVKAFTDKHTNMHGAFPDSYIKAGKDVCNRMQLDWSRFKKEYKALKTLTALINSRLGITFTCFVVKATFYYSTHFSQYLVMTYDSTFKILNLIYLTLNCSSTVAMFFLSGDICKRVLCGMN